ncbi:MAG: long-chain-acyl-CoA synthetase [Sinobacteraceae bacterium]|nr:long-chain-acyl-CoA synthetase [Nevskiaceae bacterium]
MKRKDHQTIPLRELARGVVRSLPEAWRGSRGAWNLLWLKPERPGSIGRLLERQARRHPGRIALRFEDRQWTYAQFNAWANRCAALFRSQGVKAGDAVGILMENRPEVLACVAGAVKLGAVAAMLNTQQHGQALTHSLALVQPKLLVVGEECRGALESTPWTPRGNSSPVYFWDGPGAAPEGYRALAAACEALPSTDPPETAQVRLRQPCFYIFTSGTTGLPKASVMTHYRWLRGMAGLGQMALRLTPEDVFYCALPLYHNNALTVSWGAALGAGCTLALARKFSARRFWDDVRDSGATAFCYIGELCRYLLNQPETPRDREHRVRLMVGNGLRPELWEAFERRFGIERIYEFYGASEANIAFVNAFGLPRTAGFCPLSYAIVQYDGEREAPVRGADGYMRRVARGEVGLLLAEVTDRSPFDGYTEKDASEEKLLHDVFRRGDRWFNTGDLVRDQGYRHIQFVDRLGDTFRWKGENVATTEVEAALNRFPGVTQAVVYGVQIPGTEGRAGMAALTLAGPLDGRRLAQHLREALPDYAVPRFLRLREEHDTTGTFKYRKTALKREGFDPGKIPEPLYVLLDPARGYQPLDAQIHQRILQGEIRL